MARLKSVELPPFQKAIAAGVDSVMVAHVSIPALDSDPNHVATTSPAIVTGLLKNQLGFKGIVVTDALDMAGLTRLYGAHIGRAAVDAFKAGNDVLLIPADLDASYRAMLEAVRSGEISPRTTQCLRPQNIESKGFTGPIQNAPGEYRARSLPWSASQRTSLSARKSPMTPSPWSATTANFCLWNHLELPRPVFRIRRVEEVRDKHGRHNLLRRHAHRSRTQIGAPDPRARAGCPRDLCRSPHGMLR